VLPREDTVALFVVDFLSHLVFHLAKPSGVCPSVERARYFIESVISVPCSIRSAPEKKQEEEEPEETEEEEFEEEW
jgi:hypothetical protein